MTKKQCPQCKNVLEVHVACCGHCRLVLVPSARAAALPPACVRIGLIVFGMASLVAMTARFL